MARTLAQLRMVNTNAALRRIRIKHGLSTREIADLCMVSYDTAQSWHVKPDSKRHRRMPNRALELLKMKLGET